MSGLFRRTRRTRPAAAEESRTEQPAPSEPRDAIPTAEPPGGGTPLAGLRDLPAGLEPEELRSPRPTTDRRSRVRRRARYLRRVRELLLRDLGGLVYEIHRSAGGDRAHQEGLVAAKAQRLAALDAELHALEARLGGAHPQTVLREPGVGGVCPACGELHASDARFCSACGQPLTEGAAATSGHDQAATSGHDQAATSGHDQAATSGPDPAVTSGREGAAGPAERAASVTHSPTDEASTAVQPPTEPPRQAPADHGARFTGNGHAEDLAPAERRS